MMSHKLALSIAVHGLNNTANPESLIPTLLVFGIVPKLPLSNIDHLYLDQRERFSVMEGARKGMEQIVAEQRIKLASKTRVKAMDVFGICPGSKLLVYRKKILVGPFKLFQYDNYKTAYVDTVKMIEPFSITAVKLYRHEISEKENEVLNPEIGKQVEIYWPNDDKYYPGVIYSYDESSRK